jgi:methionyl-tRNA formyltransferase
VKQSPQRYLVAGCKSWQRRLFDDVLSKLVGDWQYVGEREQLTLARVRELGPRYAFFLHWSWKVPAGILEEVECVCFHMTDVPYGRGGSPLQNLIARGHRDTKLTALRMTAEFDAGPVYLKRNLSLEGGAEEIYIRASTLSAEMIKQIVQDEMQPLPQTGEPVNFTRRKPKESQIAKLDSLEDLHDFIRMLDAEGYPRAFLSHAGYRFEFSRSALYDGRIVADVRITAESEGSKTQGPKIEEPNAKDPNAKARKVKEPKE